MMQDQNPQPQSPDNLGHGTLGQNAEGVYGFPDQAGHNSAAPAQGLVAYASDSSSRRAEMFVRLGRGFEAVRL